MRSLISWLSGLKDGVADWVGDMERAHALREDLHAMDDRMLDDIGLRREDIAQLLAGRLPARKSVGQAATPVKRASCPWCGRPLARPCP